VDLVTAEVVSWSATDHPSSQQLHNGIYKRVPFSQTYIYHK
jgi:hypothetical protein